MVAEQRLRDLLEHHMDECSSGKGKGAPALRANDENLETSRFWNPGSGGQT